MTLFLRNKKNETIMDVEIVFNIVKQDLHTCINIEQYSKLLLENLDRREELIKEFTEITELRTWFWEVYIEMSTKPTKEECVKEVKELLLQIANKYNLIYVGD